VASQHPHANASLIGLDNSGQSLAIAQEHAARDPRLRFEPHDLQNALPFGDASVDVPNSSNLLECLPDPAMLVREMARVLRPGGQVVAGHWDWDSQVFDGADKTRIRRLVHAFADWQQAWMEHSDGWMARRLWGLFNRGGHFTGAMHAVC
jgi:SAM-dependent methyltransferase